MSIFLGYLCYREPLPVNMNPFFIFKKHEINNDMVDVTARYIAAAGRFYQVI